MCTFSSKVSIELRMKPAKVFLWIYEKYVADTWSLICIAAWDFIIVIVVWRRLQMCLTDYVCCMEATIANCFDVYGQNDEINENKSWMWKSDSKYYGQLWLRHIERKKALHGADWAKTKEEFVQIKITPITTGARCRRIYR